MLKDSKDLQPAVRHLKESFSDLPSVQVKAWKEISKLYQQVVEYYKMQNSVINTILATLVLLGIINTIGMSIYERTLEIGTCRALGDRRSDILRQFFCEGIVLFGVSIILALPVSQIIVSVVNSMNILIDMPGASLKIPIEITPYPGAYFRAVIVVFFATITATMLPAWNASRIEIVEALRK